MQFAKKNPHCVLYLKPRRHRSGMLALTLPAKLTGVSTSLKEKHASVFIPCWPTARNAAGRSPVMVAEFLNGERHWQSAQPVRLAWDGKLYTQDEFTQWYGRAFWPDAPTGRAKQPAMAASAAAAPPGATSAMQAIPPGTRTHLT